MLHNPFKINKWQAKILLVLVWLVSLYFQAKAQQCEWLNVEGAAGSQTSQAIAVDKANNVITAGHYNDSFTVGTYHLAKTAGQSAHLIKYDVNGNVKWAIATQSNYNMGYWCRFMSVTTDPDKNIYVAGNMYGYADFGNGVTYTNTVYASNNMLVKYDSNGVAQWVRGIIATVSAAGASQRLLIDKQNNIVLGCTFSGTITFGGSSSSYTSNGSYDFILAKYTSSGNFIRAKNLGSTTDDLFNSFGCDDNSNIYMLGYSFGSFYFGSQQLKDSGEVILKMDSAFNAIKGKKTNLHVNGFYVPSYGIAVLGNGTFATTSQLYDSVYYGNGVYLVSPWSYINYPQKRLMSIVYYDANLVPIWARKNETISAVSTTIPVGGIFESNDYLYFGGTLEKGNVKFGSSPMTFVGTPTSTQMFFAKMDLRGNFLWAFTNDQTNSFSYMYGLTADYIGDLLVTGVFTTRVKMFNKSQYASVTTQTYDIYTAKISDYTITRGYVSSGPYCAGDTMYVPYTKKGIFNPGNQFIAELSDSAGNFETGYRELGRITDTAAGLIKGLLPLFNIASNNRYRIRILSTDPVVQSFYKVDTLRLLIYSKDTANAGPDTSICSGQSVRLGTTGGSRWQWSPTSSMPNAADSSNRQPVVKPTVTTEYRIIISDSSGCGEIDTDYVVVNVRPLIDAKINGDTTICKGYKQTLRASVTGGDSTRYWYQWKLIGFGLTLSNADTLSVAPLSNTAYRLVVGDNCSGVDDTAFFFISINNTFEAIPSPDTTICKGKTATISVAGSGCNPKYYKYEWYVKGQPTLLGSGKTLSVSPATTTTYSVIVSDSTTAVSDTAEVKVTVDNVFTVSLTKDSTICAGQYITLNAGVISCDTSQMEYTWDNSLGKGPIQTVSPTTTTTYTVTGTNLFNGLSDTKKVTVTVRPPLKVTANADTTICIGQTAQLRAIIQGGRTATHKIVWTANNSAYTDTTKTVNVSPAITTTYTATLSDGCTTLPDSAKITVTVRQPLKISLSADTTVCFGETTQLRATLSGGYAPTHVVQWTENIGTWTGNSTTETVNPTQTTVYKAVLKDNCTTTADSALVTITVWPPLKVTANPDTTICTGQSVQLKATLAGGFVPQHSIVWTETNGTWTDTNTNATVAPTSTTTYKVLLGDNCSSPNDSATVTVTVRPPLQITHTSKDSICANQILLLEIAPSGGYAPQYQIQWTTDNGLWTSTQNPTTDTPKVNTNYIVRLRDNCSPDVFDTLRITVLPTPKADFSVSPLSGCPPLTITLSDQSTGNDTLLNSWTIAANEVKGVATASQILTKPGGYNIGLTVSNALGCWDNAYKNNLVTVFDKPRALFVVKPDIKEIETPVYLHNVSSRATQFIWQFGDGKTIHQNTLKDSLYIYTDTGTMLITLIAQNDRGCLDTLTQVIHIFDKINCAIPSAFTANTDGLNDVFSPVCVGIATYHMTIYNRWGQVILDCDDCAWNGTYDNQPVPQGVYMYQLKFIAQSHKEGTAFGTVQVLR